MKKGSTFLMIGLTLAFLGFVAGMLVGRSINQNNVTIQSPSTTSAAPQADTLAAPTTVSDLININTAPIELLDTLPGIGPVLAQRIVDYRQTNGDFKNISELSNVEGIGNEKLLAIYDMITVGG